MAAVALAAVVSIGASAAGARQSSQSLQEAWIVGAGSVWAWTQDETGPIAGGGAQGIELTTNSGRSWSEVTPKGLSVQGGKHWISGLFALNAADAWTTYGGLSDSGAQTIVRTTDGGRRWTVVGPMPRGRWCSLQFVSPETGWCAVVGAASGSAMVILYRTVDGGQHWEVVSRTAGFSSSTPPGKLPYPGDKNIEFTSRSVGWTLFNTPGGTAPLFQTRDGGRTWWQRQVAPAPAARGGGNFGGVFVGRPVLDGRYGAVGYYDQERLGSRTIVYVTSDGGLSWHPVTPPGPPAPWLADTLTARRWRLFDGNRILETSNAGRSWQTITTNHDFSTLYYSYNSPTPPVADFLTSSTGWVVQDDPAGNNTLWRSTDGGHSWAQIKVRGT